MPRIQAPPSAGGSFDDRYVNVAGDTMAGSLILHDQPTADLQASTKSYVDEVRRYALMAGEL